MKKTMHSKTMPNVEEIPKQVQWVKELKKKKRKQSSLVGNKEKLCGSHGSWSKGYKEGEGKTSKPKVRQQVRGNWAWEGKDVSTVGGQEGVVLKQIDKDIIVNRGDWGLFLQSLGIQWRCQEKNNSFVSLIVFQFLCGKRSNKNVKSYFYLLRARLSLFCTITIASRVISFLSPSSAPKPKEWFSSAP